MNEELIKDLKSKGYDIMAQIQFLQAELAKVNQQIAEEVNKPKEEKE